MTFVDEEAFEFECECLQGFYGKHCEIGKKLFVQSLKSLDGQLVSGTHFARVSYKGTLIINICPNVLGDVDKKKGDIHDKV